MKYTIGHAKWRGHRAVNWVNSISCPIGDRNQKYLTLYFKNRAGMVITRRVK